MPNNFLAVLAQEKDELLKKLDLVNQLIKKYEYQNVLSLHSTVNFNDLNVSVIHSIDKYHSYNTEYPIRKKVVTIIKNENRFLHVREIAAIAHHFEKEVPVNIFIKKISPALSILKNLPDSGLMRITVDNSHFNTFWGSKNWMEVGGNILAPHIYNIAQIANYNKEKYVV